MTSSDSPNVEERAVELVPKRAAPFAQVEPDGASVEGSR